MGYRKRTAVRELEWVLQQVNLANSDRNPNRQAQIAAAVGYGLAVAIARRSKEPLPERPDMKRAV